MVSATFWLLLFVFGDSEAEDPLLLWVQPIPSFGLV